MRINFKGLYKISYYDMNQKTKSQCDKMAIDTLGMYDDLGTDGYKYDGIYQKIKPERESEFESANEKNGFGYQKVDTTSQKTPQYKGYGCSPKDYRLTDFIKILQDGKVTDVCCDKYKRPVVTVDNIYKVIQQKSGNKIVQSDKITLFIDKNNQITRAICPLQEMIYFPNGSSLHIKLKDGKRTGDYNFYSKEYPEGIEVKSYGEDGNGIRYSNISPNPLENVNILSDGEQVVKYDEEADTIKSAEKTYTPELLRAVALGKVSDYFEE